MTRALITGIAGQDGSYLADLLLDRGVEVHGTVRPDQLRTPGALWRLAGVLDRVDLHALDLLDTVTLGALVGALAPDLCFHLTGTRRPIASPGEEAELLEGAIATTHTLLAAQHRHRPGGAFFLAASSEMYGPEPPLPQDEGTPLEPGSIYAIAKAAGFQLVRHYRQDKGFRACSGILFNHESPRRGEGYVTRQITQAAARIKMGLAQELVLGDLGARRDWGHARSFTRGMILMAGQDAPEDLVLATGVTHSVGDFVEAAFGRLGLDPRDHVREDPSRPRPMRQGLVGNPDRAFRLLGWRDEVPFRSLVEEMADADLERVAGHGGQR